MTEDAKHVRHLTSYSKVILGIIAAALVVAACGVVYMSLALTKSDKSLDATTAESKDLASTVDAVCKTNGPEAKKLRAAGKCEQAKQVIDRPGPAGPRGEAGAVGPKGDPGTPCAPANPACRGPRGATGPPGPTPACMLLPSKCVGPAGTPGVKGDKGDKGDSVKGDKGDTGAAGQDGVNGVDGTDGADGKDGADGAKGDKGDPGDPGCPPGNHLFSTNVLTKDQPVDGIAAILCVPDIGP